MFKACFCRIVEDLSFYLINTVKYMVIRGTYRNSKYPDEILLIFRQETL